MLKYKNHLGLGIAGNFALHLDQAGEAEDFKDVITADEAAPKGMFPFYIPSTLHSAKEILSTYPLDAHTIKLPSKDLNIQAEPEVALVCSLEYTDKKLTKILPKFFGAYNDCSIRVKGAKKISDKKNWGTSSKGISDTLFKIDKFEKGGVMDNFSIASFLHRDGEVHAYGENIDLNAYSYFYTTLTDWMTHQINTQKDFGPLENLSKYIQESHFPSEAIISIGATRYTHYGETTFLRAGDEVIVVVYNHDTTSLSDLHNCIKNSPCDSSDISLLRQKVIL